VRGGQEAHFGVKGGVPGKAQQVHGEARRPLAVHKTVGRCNPLQNDPQKERADKRSHGTRLAARKAAGWTATVARSEFHRPVDRPHLCGAFPP